MSAWHAKSLPIPKWIGQTNSLYDSSSVFKHGLSMRRLRVIWGQLHDGGAPDFVREADLRQIHSSARP